MFCMNTISSRVRLPLKVCSGSVGKRKEFAENMLSNFVNKIDPEFNKKQELSINRIQAILRESLPYKKIYVEVVESEGCNGNNFLIHCNEENCLDGVALELVTNEKGKVSIKDRNSLFHEAWHFFEQISNPKMFARTMQIDDALTNRYTSFYHNNFYTLKKFKPVKLEAKLERFLEQIDDYQDRVNILQQLRYDLQGEYNAYSIAEKYAHEDNHYKNFHFLEKREIVCKKLKAVLAEIRSAKLNKAD